MNLRTFEILHLHLCLKGSIPEKGKGNMFLIIGINTDNFEELDYLCPYSAP